MRLHQFNKSTVLSLIPIFSLLPENYGPRLQIIADVLTAIVNFIVSFDLLFAESPPEAWVI